MESDKQPERPLLACSVFAGGERDEFWLDLQRRQLESTSGTGGYEHAVYLGAKADPRLFSGSIVVGRSERSGFWEDRRYCSEHLEGLRGLAEFAAAAESRYSGFLIVDSDAFPIHTDWMSILNSQLSRLEKSYAAAVRMENLDSYPHPCVVYSPQARFLRFRIAEMGNLLGSKVADIVCEEESCLPLLKSNAVSPHPLLATVYSGLFYHHGCGSRKFLMRSVRSGYYDPLLRDAPSSEALFEALRRSPGTFLTALNGGWTQIRELCSVNDSVEESRTMSRVAALP